MIKAFGILIEGQRDVKQRISLLGQSRNVPFEQS